MVVLTKGFFSRSAEAKLAARRFDFVIVIIDNVCRELSRDFLDLSNYCVCIELPFVSNYLCVNSESPILCHNVIPTKLTKRRKFTYCAKLKIQRSNACQAKNNIYGISELYFVCNDRSPASRLLILV